MWQPPLVDRADRPPVGLEPETAAVPALRLAGELGLRHIGHADHRIAEALIGHAFGVAGELRTLHAEIGAAARDRDTLGLGGGGKMDAQPRRHRMRHRYVRDAALAEERAFAHVSMAHPVSPRL